MKRGRKILCMLLAVILLVGTIPMAASAYTTVTPSQVLAEARRYVGVPYLWGGKTPSGFDCTGFVAYTYGNLGTGITYSQVYSRTVPGTTITGSANFQPGDIIFGESSPGVGHCGICTGSGTWIDCGSSKGVSERSYSWMSKISFAIRPSCLSGTATPPPHTHTWDDGRITTAPTESSTGIKTYTCTGCGATKTETVAKLPHTHKWDNGKVTKEATVSATGVLTYTCTGCGQTKTETIPIITKADGKCGDNVTWSYDGTTNTLTLSGTGPTYDYDPLNNANNPAPWLDERGISRAARSIIISPGITTIGEHLFYACRASSVSIPTSVESIGKQAFYGCSNLYSITIPKGKIGVRAFAGCSGLWHVTLQEGVTEIERGAFDIGSEKKIKTIWLPSTVVKLHVQALIGIPAVDISENNPAYTVQNGVVYSKDLTELVHYPEEKTDTIFAIPSGVEIVKEWAVNFNWFLKEIIVPEGVTTLEDYAFYWNYTVTSITLPRSLKTVGEEALYCHDDFFRDIYYGGTESEWQAIDFSHAAYPSIVTVHFTEEDPDFPDPKPTIVKFSDVFEGEYYADAVQWAVENGITSGTDATHFSPGAGCTRAQAVTFLWRAAGEPEPKGTAARFTDVKAGAYYEKAVRWAVEQGITSGTSATRFSPNATCTRAQIVTFLWRREGSPEADGNSFSDVKTGEYYENAVKWAVKQGITSGTSATRFSPNSNCVRAQIVTFLYRYEA